VVPEGVLVLTGPFPIELGVPVPQPETSSIPRDVTPATWAKRGPRERIIKATVLGISIEKWGNQKSHKYEEIAGTLTCLSGLSQSLSGNTRRNFGHG
jgi:predicted SAM-dependent methyltransferase